MHVFLSALPDTAYVGDFAPDELLALCDYLNEAYKTAKSDVIRLRWTKQSVRARKADLLWIMRYWVTPMGVRKLRIQTHKIYEDGRIGRRQIREERHQGRVVR